MVTVSRPTPERAVAVKRIPLALAGVQFAAAVLAAREIPPGEITQTAISLEQGEHSLSVRVEIVWGGALAV